MKFNIKILFLIAVLMQSCWGDKGAPNYEYMPNMYESLSYESYSENNLFKDNLSARLPVEGTIPREEVTIVKEEGQTEIIQKRILKYQKAVK